MNNEYYLDLNKKENRESVAFRLMMMGYDITENAGIYTIQAIIRKIQHENGLVVDGLIREDTMRLLMYSDDFILKEVKMFDYIKTKIQYWKDEIEKDKQRFKAVEEKHHLCSKCKFSRYIEFNARYIEINGGYWCLIKNDGYSYNYPCKECKYFKEKK